MSLMPFSLSKIKDAKSLPSDTIEASAMGFIFYDKNENLYFANQSAKKLLPPLGKNGDVLKTLKSFVEYALNHTIQDDLSMQQLLYTAVALENELNEFRSIILPSPGIFVLCQAVRTAAEETTIVLTNVTDLRKKDQERSVLNKRNHEMLTAIEASGIGIVVSDPKLSDLQNLITFANSKFCNMLGLPKNDVIYQDWDFILEAQRIPGSIEEMHKAMEAERTFTTQLSTVDHSGIETWYELKIVPVFDESGALDLYVGIQSDITLIKQRETELFHTQKMEALGKLAGGVAHDFNNVLSIIQGFSRMIEKMSEDEKLTSHVQKIESASKRGAALTQKLLAFGRHNIVVDNITDMHAFFEEHIDLVKPLVEASINLNLDIGEEDMWVEATKDQLNQIVMNLVVNARDAIEENGEITLSCHITNEFDGKTIDRESDATDPYVKISVRDTGTGIPPDILARIFDPFFTTKQPGSGTGLGLSMVYSIVKQLGGHIDIKSKQGKGTGVDVYLPKTDKRPATKAMHYDGDLTSLKLEGYTALLAEDEPDLCDVIKDSLEQIGMTVLTAANGNEALARQDDYDGDIDFLITDVVMPEMNGVKLSELFLSMEPKTNVIFMSGYPAYGHNSKIILPEGAMTLQKPFDENRLYGALYDALQKGRKKAVNA